MKGNLPMRLFLDATDIPPGGGRLDYRPHRRRGREPVQANRFPDFDSFSTGLCKDETERNELLLADGI